METILVITILLTCCQYRSSRERTFTVFVGSCVLFDGSISWFKYVELIDHTVLEAGKRGPALKNRLIGVAEKYKGLLNRESLRAEDGVKYFRDSVRHQFIKGSRSVFVWRFYLFIRARRGNTEMVSRIGKFSLLLKRLKDSWMNLLPLSGLTQQPRESQYPADMTQLNADRRSRTEAPLDPSPKGIRDNWYATHVTTLGSLFPFNDILTTLMFIVASDLNEAQRETHNFSLSRIRISLLTPLTQCKHSLWNCSVRRKAQLRILLSA